MKKYFSIFILVFYSIATCGYIIETHYCAGEISDIKIKTTSNEKPNCGCGDESEIDFCCKNEYKSYKLSFDQKVIFLTKNIFESKQTCNSSISIENYLSDYKYNFILDFQFHPPNKNSIQSINSIYLI